MAGKIAIDRLNPHPKNGYYFTDIDGEKYAEVKRSIATHGIRDPLKVTTAYTIISGHQRYRIARDLGLREVPVEIIDVDEWQAEYLLIAENVERRGVAEVDPIKKARIAQFLKEYWGVKHGNNQHSRRGQNVPSKTTKDIGEAIGTDVRTTKRLLKLNDLIPEFQSLVSAGNLGTTAAEQLAYLSPATQQSLWAQMGAQIGDKTVSEVKALRKRVSELEQAPPKVVVDESTQAELSRYKRRFGDLSQYESDGVYRITNEVEVSGTALMFSDDVRDLIQKYAFLPAYDGEFATLNSESRKEYETTLGALMNFANGVYAALGTGNVSDAVIDAEFTCE